MLKRMIGLLRRIFHSKGFRTAVRILAGLFLAWFIVEIIYTVFLLMTRVGMSFWEAVSFTFEGLLTLPDYFLSLSGFGVGIVFGLIWYFYRRWKNRQPETASEEEPKEETEEKDPPAQEPAQEEIIETQHYMFH